MKISHIIATSKWVGHRHIEDHIIRYVPLTYDFYIYFKYHLYSLNPLLLIKSTKTSIKFNNYFLIKFNDGLHLKNLNTATCAFLWAFPTQRNVSKSSKNRLFCEVETLPIKPKEIIYRKTYFCIRYHY